MKVSQENKFQAVTIIIETELELAYIYNNCNREVGYVPSELAMCLFEKKIMSRDRAKKIISESENENK